MDLFSRGILTKTSREPADPLGLQLIECICVIRILLYQPALVILEALKEDVTNHYADLLFSQYHETNYRSGATFVVDRRT